jgi:MarR family transcriptional regulator for hemolysin
MKPKQATSGILVPTLPLGGLRRVRPSDWRKDLLVSWLFQTCIELQTSLNRRFFRFGMTVQAASVLIRCVEAKQISHGHLAEILSRDRGMVTRFVDGLEAMGLVKREVTRRDRRCSVILPTGKGKRRANELALVFASVRKKLFAGIPESDTTRLSSVLPRLRRNALAMGTSRKAKGMPRRRGSH